MKKTLFAMVVAAMAFAVNASAQFSVGVGYANETINSKTSAILEDNVTGFTWEKNKEQLNGFYVEAAYDWTFASAGGGDFVLQPGVRYYYLTRNNGHAKRNIKYSVDDVDMHIKANKTERISNHVFDIPVNVKYAYDFVPGALKGYVFAGPTFSFGLAAKDVTRGMYYGTDGKETVKYTDIERYNGYTGKYYFKTYDQEKKDYDIEKGKKDTYKAYNMFDLKIAVGLGVTVAEKVDIKFGYNIGLLNRSFIKNTDDIKQAAHSNVLHFGVAYRF